MGLYLLPPITAYHTVGSRQGGGRDGDNKGEVRFIYEEPIPAQTQGT